MTAQTIFESKVVDEVREIFGDKSVEYGLVISGSTKLVPWLKKRYDSEHFTPEDILVVDKHPNNGHVQVLITRANELIRIRALTKLAEDTGRRDEPPWFKTD